ncbi:hypothetical protein DID88_004500 [Monilinia fructigena]|uniref:C3HC-type domain-containing protein n=1 Tax=Monilinia fructigena TaxID=38457 RepID=A0A395IRG2_9HELO|nr:hypothetical protein DID88_004500 [Monilinia fructigena]
MNTTKRKFNALLNGLGNKKSDSSLSAGAHEKPRISYSSSAATANRLSSLTRASSAAASELDNARRNLSPVAKLSPIPVSTEEPPKWAPYDRTEFLKRLKSFSNLTDWTPKPTRVNEVEWAKRGWKEEDGREKEVYIAENIENALVDKYVELIITSH